MDPGYRSPLVDLFLRGGATRDVRLLAARGLMPRPAHEQIALLVVLVDDPDPEIAAQADATISRLPAEALEGYLSTEGSPELRAFFSSRTDSPTAAPSPAVETTEPAIAAEASGEDDADTPSAAEGSDDDAADSDSRLVSTLPIAERLKLATKGTREQRAQLIRDSNRIVATAVLTSPKLT